MVDNASSPTFSGNSHSSNVTTLDLKIQIEFEDSSPNVVTFEEWPLPLFGVSAWYDPVTHLPDKRHHEANRVSAWYDPVTHHLKQNMMFGNVSELCPSNI